MCRENPRSTKHSGAVQSESAIQPKQSSASQPGVVASSPVGRKSRVEHNLGSSHDRKSSLPPLSSHSALPAHPASSLAVPASNVPSSSAGINGQQLVGSQEATAGFDMGANNGSGASTSMNAPFVDTHGMLGNGSLPDMPASSQPVAKRAKMGNPILPEGALLVLLPSCHATETCVNQAALITY